MSGPRGERGPSGAPGGALAVVHRLDVAFAARGDEAPLRTLEDVSLRIDPGEFVALVGPSGSGKSTLVRAIAGLLPGSAHAVAHDDATDPVCVATRPDPRRPGGRVRDVAWMGQKDALLPWRRALDNAAVGARLAGASPTKARRDAAELMERFGLGGFERAWPHELSGGMRQRLALARTVLAGRRLLLLDEPFSGLDALTRREMNAWLRETDLVSPTDGAVVLVTHDVDEALTLADRVVVLSARPGRVVDELRAGAPAGHEAAALRARLLELLGVPAA